MLGTDGLQPESDDQAEGVAVVGRWGERLASWNGRPVIVGLAVGTVVISMVSVVVRELT